MNVLQRKKPQTEYFNPSINDSCCMLGQRLQEMLQNEAEENTDTIILCIGTDRATGDSLGPLVGSILSESPCSYKIYGTLRHPVHALNLKEYILRIYNSHTHPTIIAVDASLGNSSDVGLITLSNSPLFPGIGVNKKLPAIGDISITGIVNMSGKPGLSLLQSTRLYSVMKMSEYIANALLIADSSTCTQRSRLV